MTEYETESGLTVASRAVLPRDFQPNAGGSGPNDPPVSVGPTSSEGFGNTNVMFDAGQPPPLQAQAWSGWPVNWDTPTASSPTWLVSRTSTVGTCCDTIGRTVATFKPLVMRSDELLAPQPFWTQNPEPLLYASFDEWIRGLVNSLLIAGDAFLLCTGRNAEGFPVRWATLNPFHVRIEIVDGAIAYKLNDVPLEPASDVLQIKYQAVPGQLNGVAPLEWVARNTLTADTLAKFANDIATRGGVPWGVFTVPGNLRQGQAQEVRDQWIASQLERNGAPAVVSGGMTLQTLSFSPEQMALLSLREFDEQRVAAAFGVPPFFVGLPQPSGLNYTSTAMLADLFYRNTLRPIAKNIADALSGWALPRGTNVLFDASDYVQPSIDQWIHALVEAAGAGAVTPEEIRRAAGLPAVPSAPVPDPMGVTA